jgi:hypothetical protein
MDRGRNVRRRVADRAQLHSIDRASLLPEVTSHCCVRGRATACPDDVRQPRDSHSGWSADRPARRSLSGDLRVRRGTSDNDSGPTGSKSIERPSVLTEPELGVPLSGLWQWPGGGGRGRSAVRDSRAETRSRQTAAAVAPGAHRVSRSVWHGRPRGERRRPRLH